MKEDLKKEDIKKTAAAEGREKRAETVLEDWKPVSEKEQLAFDVVKTLRGKGTAFFAGGYVRDLLINREFNESFVSKDIDVATDLLPEEVMALLKQNGFGAKFVGKKFGTMKAYLGNESRAVDVATFREDKEYVKGRRPKKVIFLRDPQKDAERRDFTINALFFDPQQRQVLDFVGGVDDLKNRILKPVGEPAERFKEDYLRMLRYVRFRNKYDFKFSREVKEIIKANADKIKDISAERIYGELDQMIKFQHSYRAFADLARLGLLENILPEVSDLKGVEHGISAYHKEGDAFRHTLEVMRSFSRKEYIDRIREWFNPGEKDDDETVIEKFFEHYGSEVAWAALFHDLGKKTTGETRTEGGKEKISFHGHEFDSRDAADKICRRLRFSGDKREKIVWLVENHTLAWEIPKLKQSRRRTLLKHPWIEELLFLVLADGLGNFPSKIKDADKIFAALKEERARPPEAKQLLSGGEVMKEFGLEEGARVGKIIRAVREAQLEGNIKTREEAIEFVRNNLFYILNLK